MTTDDHTTLFTLEIPTTNAQPHALSLKANDVVFVLGANGTGKSTLLHNFYVRNSTAAVRLAAHRRTWLDSSAVTISPQNTQATAENIRTNTTRPEALWRGDYESDKPMLALAKLLDAENTRTRAFRATFDQLPDDQSPAESMDKLQQAAAATDSLLTAITQLLQSANMPIRISISEDTTDFHGNDLDGLTTR